MSISGIEEAPAQLRSDGSIVCKSLDTQPTMTGCDVVIAFLLVAGACAAPLAPRDAITPRDLPSMVTGVTTGLEVPRDLIAGTGTGMGTMQLVINVHTDSTGNIEVYTN